MSQCKTSTYTSPAEEDYLTGAYTITPRRENSIDLPGEIWGVTTFFNPARYQNKLDNLRYFAATARSQSLKLAIIEAAFGDEPYVVDEEDADLVMRVRARSLLWLKERLLNMAINLLPQNCDKVIWLDGDIVFEKTSWLQETKELLNVYAIVQPFSVACWLNRGVTIPKENSKSSLQQEHFSRTAEGTAYFENHYQTNGPFLGGHMGFAWAARRQILTEVGLYDSCILGGADNLIASAMFGLNAQWLLKRIFAAGAEEQARQWMKAFHSQVRGSVYYTKGRVFHLWHGERENRRHLSRFRILRKAAFDPRNDISLDSEGCWAWSSFKRELHADVADYFISRKEQ